MKRKRAVVLVLAALMAATTVFPTSAYASEADVVLGDPTILGPGWPIEDYDTIID